MRRERARATECDGAVLRAESCGRRCAACFICRLRIRNLTVANQELTGLVEEAEKALGDAEAAEEEQLKVRQRTAGRGSLARDGCTGWDA